MATVSAEVDIGKNYKLYVALSLFAHPKGFYKGSPTGAPGKTMLCYLNIIFKTEAQILDLLSLRRKHLLVTGLDVETLLTEV